MIFRPEERSNMVLVVGLLLEDVQQINLCELVEILDLVFLVE